jgi:hypothetical protein
MFSKMTIVLASDALSQAADNPIVSSGVITIS